MSNKVLYSYLCSVSIPFFICAFLCMSLVGCQHTHTHTHTHTEKYVQANNHSLKHLHLAQNRAIFCLLILEQTFHARVLQNLYVLIILNIIKPKFSFRLNPYLEGEKSTNVVGNYARFCFFADLKPSRVMHIYNNGKKSDVLQNIKCEKITN